MSDKVVVAIITTSGTLLVALIGWLSKRRKTQHKSETVPQTVIVTTPNIPSAIHVTTIQPVLRRTTDLGHKQISDAIEAVPPFQRDNIANSFIDVYVTWRGTLFGASRHKDEGWISLDDICKNGGLVHCTAPIHRCDALLIAPERSVVVVTGKIKTISKYNVELEDCSFKVLHEAVG